MKGIFFNRLLMPLVLASVFCLTLGASLPASGQPVPMSPARLVNDYAGLFTPEQTRILEDSLVAFDRTTSTQIAVVTLPDLDGMTPNEMATAIIEQWGVGRVGKDNGVVILIKPRNNNGGGQVYIGTGRGTEGALPDGKATRIIDQYMLKSLKNGDYFTAVYDGSAVIRGVLRGEFTVEDPEELPWWGVLIVMGSTFGFVLLITFLISKAAKNGGDDGADGSSGGGSGPIILGGLGGLGGFGSSRGGSGGFGGGGFGGFGGGGSFGGGGGRGF